MDKKELERVKVVELYKKYNLTDNDVFKHANYLIITRSGIEKIQAIAKITIDFEMTAINLDGTYACVKATATKGKEVLQSYGSAKRGGKDFIDVEGQTKKKFIEYGNTETWYIAEMAEKRAKSRVVLQMEGLYKEGIFGEDEADDFKDKKVSTGVASEPAKVEVPKKKESPKKEEATEEVIVVDFEKQDAKIVQNSKDAHTPEEAIETLEKSNSIGDLVLAWDLCRSWGFGSHPTVASKKDELKTKLSEK